MNREWDYDFLRKSNLSVNHAEVCGTKDPMQDCMDRVKTPTEELVRQSIVRIRHWQMAPGGPAVRSVGAFESRSAHQT